MTYHFHTIDPTRCCIPEKIDSNGKQQQKRTPRIHVQTCQRTPTYLHKTFDVKNEKKVYFRIAQLECSDKKMSNIFYWVKKKTCLGVLE